MHTKIILALFFITISQTHLHAQSDKKQSEKAQSRALNWQDLPGSMQKTQIAQPGKDGEFVIFQISDINKFLYRVEIEGKTFELQTPIPTELQTLFQLKQEDLAKTATNKKSEEAVENVSKAIEPMAEIAETANDNKVKAQESVKTAEAKVLATPANKELQEAAIVAKANKTAQSKLAASADEVVLECKKYLELAKQVSSNVFTLKETRNKLISIAQMDVPESKIHSLMATVKWPVPNLESQYNDLRELYKQLELRYSDLSAKAKAAKIDDDQQEEIESSLDKIEKANDLIEEEALLGLLNDVDFLYNELKNPNNFKAVSPPVQMDGDIVSYDVSVTPVPTGSLGAHRNPVNFTFNIPNKGGLKVDFSVGPVISFGGKAKDDKLFLEETSKTDTVILRQRSNNNSVVPSLAAMMHFYNRGSHWGGMLGVGAGFQSSSDINTNIFLGGSYIMGKRQKLMISAGLSYLRVDRLKDKEYVLDKMYNTSKITISNVTEKVFKPSIFLSISYNITNKVEIN